MKMRIFFIPIFLYTITKYTKAGNSDSKYIDLLPEKEKQEFLVNIARRILEEVQTKDDRPKESSEIPDEQLNEHDAFVQKIMNEESENLRRQTNNTEGKTHNYNIGRILGEERRDQEGDKNGDRYVDLTLRTDKNRSKRESKRRVFTKFSPDSDNSTEHESKESDVDIQVKNFRKSRNVNETTILKETDVSKTINDTFDDNITEEIQTLVQNNEKEASTQISSQLDDKETEVTTQDNLSTKDSNIEMETTVDFNDNQQKTETTTQDSFHNLPTDDTVTESVQLEVIQKTYENITYDSSKKKENENKSKVYVATSVETTSNTTNTPVKLTTQNVILDIETNETRTKELKDSNVINIEIAKIKVTENLPSTMKSIKHIDKSQNKTDSMIITTTEEIKVLTTTALDTKDPSFSTDSDILRNKNHKSDIKLIQEKLKKTQEKLKKKQEKLKNKHDTIKNKIKDKVKNKIKDKVKNEIKDKLERNKNKMAKKIKKPKQEFNMTKASTTFVNDVINALKLKFLGLKAFRSRSNPSLLRHENKTSKEQKDSDDYKKLFFFDIYPRLNKNSTNSTKGTGHKRGKFFESMLEKKPTSRNQIARGNFNEKIWDMDLMGYGRTKPEEHKVFEISPDESPFVKLNHPKSPQLDNLKSLKPYKKPNLTQPDKERPIVSEEPHVVPIYNYLPKHAFYNPHNVYGPNPDNADDDEENVFHNDGYSIPSLMPKSAKKFYQKKRQAKDEHSFHVPIYYYSPKNAYYNPKNNYGPNIKDSNEKRDENHNEYENDNYDADKIDEEKKQRKDIEWQYYDYTVIRGQDEEEPTINKKKATEKEPESKPEQQEPKEPSKRSNIREALPIYYENLFKKHKPIENRQNIGLDYYERYYDDKDLEEKKQTYNSAEKELLKDYKYEDNNHVIVLKKFVDNYNIEELIDTFRKPQKEFVEYKPLQSLQGFLTKYETPQEKIKKNNKRLKDYLNNGINYYKIYIDDNNSNINDSPEEKQQTYNTVAKKQNYTPAETELLKDYKYEENNTTKIVINNDDKYAIEELIQKYKKPHKVFDIYNPFQGFFKYESPQEKIEKNNIRLQGFLQNFKPHKYVINSRKSPEKYQEIANLLLNYAKDHSPSENNVLKEIAQIIRDPEILDIYLHLKEIEQDEVNKDKEDKRYKEVSNELDVYQEVLGDMIKEDNKALFQYDWLGSAVDLQSAIKKMSDMVKSVQNQEDLHPSDLELLRYIVNLHSYARDKLTQITKKDLRGKKALPRGRRPKHVIKKLSQIYKLWELRNGEEISYEELDEFGRFLEDLQIALYDLHTALKYIAMVTKYEHQSWFENLKRIYIEYKRRTLLELILHLSTTRLLGMIEESAKKGVEDDFMDYIKKNEVEVDRTREEFVFVLKLLEEIKFST